MKKIWKKIEDAPDYEVSDQGEIRIVVARKWGKLCKGQLVKQTARGNGYLFVNLSRAGERRSFKVHRLVAKAFVPGIGPLVRHLNRHTDDNRALNLAWGGTRENMDDAKRHGTTLRGERHPMAKLTQEQANEIRRIYAKGRETHRSLARNFQCAKTIVTRILAGKSW